MPRYNLLAPILTLFPPLITVFIPFHFICLYVYTFKILTKTHACINAPILWLRWWIQKQSGCQPSSAGTRTSVGNMQMKAPSQNSTHTSCLCLVDLRQTVSSTWRCHPLSTTMSPRTSSTAVWAQSQYTHLLTVVPVSQCLLVLRLLFCCLTVRKQQKVKSIPRSVKRPDPISQFK